MNYHNLNGYYTQSYGSSNYNFTLQGDVNKLIVPPDLFYGTASKTVWDNIRPIISLSNALNCSTHLQGIIPKHLLKNCQYASISNLFVNQDVIPSLVTSYQENSKTVNVYSQFPQNYTSYTLLDYAFNCTPVIPVNTTTETNWVFMIMQDTISNNTSSMDYAFSVPSISYNGNSKNYINYVGSIQNQVLSDGLNMNYFTKLTLDNIFNSYLNIILYGNLFNSTFDAKNIKMSSSSSYVLVKYNNYANISQYIKFPLASGQIRQLINPYGITIKASQIISSSSSKQYYVDAGITIIE